MKKNMGAMGNMGGMVKQMQKMQSEMNKIQAELAASQIEFAAGGGGVKVVISGQKELLSLRIDPSVVDPEDIEMLEDLVLAAVQGAMRQVDNITAERMQALTGGINLPGMPF